MVRKIKAKTVENSIDDDANEKIPELIEQLIGFEGMIKSIAFRAQRGHGILRKFQIEDMIQEVMLKAIVELEKFSNKSRLKTWVYNLARNHFVDMARREMIRPEVIGDTIYAFARDDDTIKAKAIREETKKLLAWLRENPEKVEHGWEALNVLLRTHGDYSYAAVSLSLHTAKAWTPRLVREKIREIKKTYRFIELKRTVTGN